MKSDTAASDLIGVMAIIAVFVTAAAIAGVALLSYPPGDAAPAMIARNVTVDGKIHIYHDGGDSLERGHFEVLIDGASWTEEFNLIDSTGVEHETWTSWNAGEALVPKKDVTVSGNSHIQIVGEGVNRIGSDWLLHGIGNGTGGTGAGPAPALAAAFTANVTEGNAPLVVQFTDQSTGSITNWLWVFGDGSTSTERHPVHTYTASGTYTVTLTVKNPNGNSSATVIITVLEPPVANFSANVTQGNAPLAVEFTDASTGDITDRFWNFGDGATSDEPNPVHVYTAAGNYTVNLTVTNGGGSNTEVKTNYITVTGSEPGGDAPIANFTANVTEGNAPIAVLFTDTSTGGPTSWSWDFGDGNTFDEQNPTHTYTVPGNYTVTLNASNTHGFSIETKIDYIVVGEPAPVIDFSGEPTSGVAPLTVNFTATNSGGNVTTWNWDFGDGNTATEQNPTHTHTYTAAGTYNVTLTATGLGGSDTKTKTDYITVLEPPAAAFTANITEGNAPLAVQFTDESTGNVTTWNWDFGDGATSTEQNWSHTYAMSGTYNVTLTATGPGGSDTETKVGYITVLAPPVAGFNVTPVEGNAPLTVQFTDESTGDITDWFWDLGDGTNSTKQSPNHTYTVPGTYTVTLNASNSYGYSVSAPITITVLEPPEAAFSANVTEGNAPLTVQFTDESTGNVTIWTWDFGDGTNSTDPSPNHTYTSPGTYTVTLNASNAYGYSVEEKVNYITVLEPPKAAFTANVTEGNAPLAVQFNDESTGNVTIWSWDFGDGNNSTDQHPTHTYTTPGTYTVSLTASNDYGEDTETKTDYITVLSPPVAAFSATPTEGNAPLTVQFNDESTGNVTTWLWDFGDGTNSTEQSPEHTYTTPGIYTVTLTASNDYGEDTETKTDYITVLEPPEAAFTANVTEGNAPLAVQFTDASTGDITAWLWNFGDGNTSTEQNPAYTYTAPGTYTVSLTASNDYGEDTETKTDYITVLEPPEAAFTANVTEGNAPLTVQFTDESAGNVTTWAWDFGDGNNSTDPSPSHTYTSPGTYAVSLTASNDYGEDTETKTDYITVLEPPKAAFTANVTEGNTPLAVQFTDESTGNITNWLWTFDDGNTSTDQHPTHTYTAPGTYTVTLNASNAYGYSVSTPITITVLEPPAAAFTANVTEGNAPLAVLFTDESTGDITAWLWNFGDGNTSAEQSPAYTYTVPGTYTVTLTASNTYGYSVSAPTTITVLEPPEAAFTANVTEGNAPLTVQFTDESTGNVTTWSWDFGDGNTSAEQNPAYTYTVPGTYTVTLNASNTYGFSIETKTDYIAVLEPPEAAFTANVTEGNAPLVVHFTDESTGNVTTWLWDFGDGNNSTDPNPNHTYTSPGTYTVTLNASNAYGYDVSAPTQIVVLEPPVAAFTANVTEGNAPLTVQFTDESTGNVTTWFWDFGDGNNSTVQHPTHTHAVPGTYTVTLNASNAYGFSIETKTDYITVLVPPVANFTANVTVIPVGAAVQFTDSSIGNITAWSWNFGDGSNSTVQNPTHTYTAPGTYTVNLTASNAYGADTESKTAYINVGYPPIANFTANVTNGPAPLAVLFTDTSANTPTSWLWDFGDGTNSTVQHPEHTYVAAGNYTVTLNVTNAYGNDTHTKEDYIRVTKSFVDFIIDENVFVYGTALQFKGNNVNGPGATIVIYEGLDTATGLPNNGAVAVSNIYINGSVTLTGRSADLGSVEVPGSIYINGDLNLGDGEQNVYGDVYVNGDFNLKDARIHGNVYVNGDLTLGNTPWIADDAYINYTGTIRSPLDDGSGYDLGIIAKCIKQETVPGFTMPGQGIPPAKSPDTWYTSRGYVSDGDLTSDLKIFADSYTSTSGNSANNVIIIANDGDITITGQWSTVTGIFFAPRGKVTFNGNSLEGVVIARDGFFVTSGGTSVTFKNVEEYINKPEDYPF